MHAHLHNTHTLQFEETALMKPAHWTEFQSDFSTRVNYRNCVCVFKNVCFKMYSTHAREPLEELFSTVAIAWFRCPHHWEKTSHYKKTKKINIYGVTNQYKPHSCLLWRLKVIVYTKVWIMSSFTHIHVIWNLCDFFLGV